MLDVAQQSLPEEVMNTREMMIIEEIKRKSGHIYISQHCWRLTTLKTALSLNQSSTCMLSTITCFVGYCPQGCIAHTMAAAKRQIRNTHMHSLWVTQLYIEHNERHESNLIINVENSRKSSQRVFLNAPVGWKHCHSGGNSPAVLNHYSGVSFLSNLNANYYMSGLTILLIQQCRLPEFWLLAKKKKWHLRTFFAWHKTHWWQCVFQEDQGSA